MYLPSILFQNRSPGDGLEVVLSHFEVQALYHYCLNYIIPLCQSRRSVAPKKYYHCFLVFVNVLMSVVVFSHCLICGMDLTQSEQRRHRANDDTDFSLQNGVSGIGSI